MFKSIRLENFKAYRDSGNVPLAPLTVIVGLNNTGKSTLLHAILALKQTAQDAAQGPALVTAGPLVNLNGFYDILHSEQKAKDGTFTISLSTDIQQSVLVQSGPQGRKEVPVADGISVSFGLDREAKDIEVVKSTLALGQDVILGFERGKDWFSDTLPTGIPRTGDVTFRNFLPTLAFGQQESPTVISPELLEAVSQLSFHAHLWTHSLVNGVHSVGPIRRRVPWSASLGTRAPSEFGLGGENLLAALGSDEKIGPLRKTLLEYLNEWVGSKQILARVHVEGKNGSARMLLGDEVGGPKDINIAGMGEGISQILPIIARTSSVAYRSCLLVEQPEIHLHPALQADLADLFIKVVTSNLQRQVIVETHSEHLVLRVRRRIAEGMLDPKNVAVLYVEKKGTESKVRRLDVNSRGHFDDWPDGFFDEAYQEAMALALAKPQG